MGNLGCQRGRAGEMGCEHRASLLEIRTPGTRPRKANAGSSTEHLSRVSREGSAAEGLSRDPAPSVPGSCPAPCLQHSGGRAELCFCWGAASGAPSHHLSERVSCTIHGHTAYPVQYGAGADSNDDLALCSVCPRHGKALQFGP